MRKKEGGSQNKVLIFRVLENGKRIKRNILQRINKKTELTTFFVEILVVAITHLIAVLGQNLEPFYKE